MGHDDFQTKVLEGLATLSTKMDGVKETLSDHEDRIRDLKSDMDKRRGGIGWLSGTIAGGATYGVLAGIKTFFGHH